MTWQWQARGAARATRAAAKNEDAESGQPPARQTIGKLRRLGRPLFAGLVLSAALVLMASQPLPASLLRGAPGQQQPPPGGFLDTFEGRPDVPTKWRGDGWDVTIHSRDKATWDNLEPTAAHHGPGCTPPPDTHPATTYDDAVFQCNGHIMTSINAGGYGVIYLTPNQLVDFSHGEAVVRFDLSTLRTSARDWVDIWLSPYEDHLQLPLDNWLPDLTGEPRRAVHLRMDNQLDLSIFKAFVFRDSTEEELKLNQWWGYEKVVTPSAVRRDTIELRISRTSIKLGMPQYDFWWIDSRVQDLGWDKAVLQLGHHSYSPFKCEPRCQPNTWHWDNVSIAPAVPFTIVPSEEQRWVSEEDGPTVTFAAPAPPDSHLRFVAIGSGIEVSFDGGASWQAAQPRPVRGGDLGSTFFSYWTPMPAGATEVKLRGDGWRDGTWRARDFSIWSQQAPS